MKTKELIAMILKTNVKDGIATLHLLLITLLFILLPIIKGLSTPSSGPVILYVNADASGTNNGTTWLNAFNDLQDGINNQCGGLAVWVTEGIYSPLQDQAGNLSPINPRDKNFHLAQDMEIYGGFTGVENELNERDLEANETILSGDFDNNDSVVGSGDTLVISNNDENAFHVFITANLSNNAIIDGFSIVGGNASGTDTVYFASKPFLRENGGGIYNVNSSPKIVNANFSGNSALFFGGGVQNESSSPAVSNSIFLQNFAESGGGMSSSNSLPSITNSMFKGNSATDFGGGLCNKSADLEIFNLTFSGNSAGSGGGVYNSNSSPIITNSSFSRNSASAAGGGAVFNENSSPAIRNTIFWENAQNGSDSTAGADIQNLAESNPTVEYCLTQANSIYATGNGIINDKDPHFEDALNSNLLLKCTSPIINIGDNTAWGNTGLSNDITGSLRPYNAGVVDMGAYEHQGLAFVDAIYVDSNATGANNGYSWADAFVSLQDAIDNQCSGLDIWVAAAIYLPTKDYSGNTSPADPRDKNFHLATYMKIYGGFTGIETELGLRDWEKNVTILSADFNQDDILQGSGETLTITNNTENAYHVLITANLTNQALVEGFKIMGGNSSGTDGFSYATRTFLRNNGGGIYNNNSLVKITNTIITGNSAENGGGMNNYASSPIISNTTIEKNRAIASGGGLFVFNSAASLSKVHFSGNLANDGGGMFSIQSSASLVNTSFFKNAALKGGQ
jgi:hypothetical protein